MISSRGEILAEGSAGGQSEVPSEAFPQGFGRLPPGLPLKTSLLFSSLQLLFSCCSALPHTFPRGRSGEGLGKVWGKPSPLTSLASFAKNCRNRVVFYRYASSSPAVIMSVIVAETPRKKPRTGGDAPTSWTEGELREIGARVKEVRLTLGMTQAAFARRIGVTQRMVQLYERGGAPVGVERRARVIAALVGKSREWLLTGRDVVTIEQAFERLHRLEEKVEQGRSETSAGFDMLLRAIAGVQANTVLAEMLKRQLESEGSQPSKPEQTGRSPRRGSKRPE